MTRQPPPATPTPTRTPSAASRRWGQGGARDDAIAARRHQPRPRAPLTPAERAELDRLLGNTGRPA